MSATQRARSGVPLAHRSALPTLPGVPAWGAVAIAVVATFVGFLIDAMRGTELTAAFSVFYFLGCLAAVLAVRNRGLFTAMVQPPLLLVMAIPLAYQHFSPGGGGLKDLALNVAIPLVNRFPLMLGTTLVVVVIGAGRIYIRRQAAGVVARRPATSSRRGVRTAAAQPRTVVEDTPVEDLERTPAPRPQRDDDRVADSARPAHATGSFPTGRYPVRTRYSGAPEEETATFDRPRSAEPARGGERQPRYETRAARPQPRESRRPSPQQPESRSHERVRRPETPADPPQYEAPRRGRAPRHETPQFETQQYEAQRHDRPAYEPQRPAAEQTGPGRRHRRDTPDARPDAPERDAAGRRGSDVPLHPIPQVRYRDRDRRDQEPPYEYR